MAESDRPITGNWEPPDNDRVPPAIVIIEAPPSAPHVKFKWMYRSFVITMAMLRYSEMNDIVAIADDYFRYRCLAKTGYARLRRDKNYKKENHRFSILGAYRSWVSYTEGKLIRDLVWSW